MASCDSEAIVGLVISCSVSVEGGTITAGSKPAGTTGSSISNSGGFFSWGGSSVMMLSFFAFFVLLP